LTVAIYSARADLSPLVFEGPGSGGHLTVSHEMESYPGMEQPLSGMELMDRFYVQPGSTRTSTDGIFVCGDVCYREYRQAVVAAVNGCVAAMEAERYLGIREKISPYE
jgi:thioredoxin reductase (NADPH)